jgi:hypothetical protein
LTTPSLNWTEPGAVIGETVAVRVTGVPRRTGDPGYVVSAVLVAGARVAAVITKSTGVDVDELYRAGSLGTNVAVSERDPTARVEVDPDAVPLLTATGLPRLRVPSLN